MKKIIRLFNTVKYLKFSQIFYRIYYKVLKKNNFTNLVHKKSKNLRFIEPLQNNICYENKKFIFLNISHSFKDKIDWNYNKYGKLWTYNLTYFDFLNQKDISKDEGLFLVHDFVSNIDEIKDGMEPFPISLRGMNWIKFLSKYDIKNDVIDNSLYAQYMNLTNHFEYHLLGNHLLENAFSLLFGAYYFQDEKFYAQAKKLLLKELDEQILDDGAHFELSPMYHQLMLLRLLNCIDLLQCNPNIDHEILLHYLTNKASLMLGWLKNITYKNGNIPLFNDSANKIAPTSIQIFDYAKKLKVNIEKLDLNESGYRKISNLNYELVVDVSNIGPDYILGHAHADTFNFELYVNEIPIIVDTGTSTYDTGTIRNIERSTFSHNTVCINKLNQSDVWGGFRVAKRAKVIDLIEKNNFISATHDGYSSIAAYHTREFIYENDIIQILDKIDSQLKYNCIAYIHFHPNIQFQIKEFSVFLDNLSIEFIGCSNLIIEEYLYSNEFNKTYKAKCLAIYFDTKLITKIAINNRNIK